MLILSGLFLCSRCRPAPPPVPEPAFYHWKTTFAPTPGEWQTLRKLGAGRLYLRFFDLDHDSRTGAVVPKATVWFGQSPAGLTVVPVVFITNRTLLHLSDSAAVVRLGEYLSRRIRQLADRQQIIVREIQLDCDWTTRTAERYFRLLRVLRQRAGVPLSATIRLHQIKFFRQTGVPPVARGMLMAYNVADWKRPETRNSIWDAAVAGQYTTFLDRYPLPLDVVLPLFRWTVVYRSGRFLRLLNALDRAELARCSFLTPQPDPARFVAARDTLAFGFSARRGDLFRAEAVTADELMAVKQSLLARIHQPKLTFAFYHLDSATLAPYPDETLLRLLAPAP
jgi:hypothetical protein